MRRHPNRDRPHDTRSAWPSGQALTEFAIILPVMLLLLLIAADFGRLFFTYIAVNNAAREAVNYAAMHAADTPFDQTTYTAGARAAALGETNAQAQEGTGTLTAVDPVCFQPGSPPTIMSCSAAANFAGGIGNQVKVTVTQPFTFLTPIIGTILGDQLTLQAEATAPVLNPMVAAIFASPTPTAAPTPTPSPSPTATATSPGATPTPSPTPSPIPNCIMPDFWHTFWNDIGTLQVWHDAGFTGTLEDRTGGKKIQSQSPLAGSSVPCTTSGWVDN